MVSCEHGGDAIPKEWEHLFVTSHDTIITSRHCEFGAKRMFDCIAPKIADYADISKVSKLLVDLDGSISNGDALSEYTQELSAQKAGQIIRDYYLPYWVGFEAQAEEWIQLEKKILVIGLHTFEPVVNNIPVGTDICLLFDHNKTEERSIALRLKRGFEKNADWIKVRFNSPKKTKQDGFMQHMRDIYTNQLLGIEIYVGENITFPVGIETIQDVVVDVITKWKNEQQ